MPLDTMSSGEDIIAACPRRSLCLRNMRTPAYSLDVVSRTMRTLSDCKDECRAGAYTLSFVTDEQ